MPDVRNVAPRIRSIHLREESNTIFVPSGDHTGSSESALAAVALVRRRRLVPSAFTRQMFRVRLLFAASVPSSLRLEWKTTDAPSGDHRGAWLSAPSAVPLVSAARPVPLGLIFQMFAFLCAEASSRSGFRTAAAPTLCCPLCGHCASKSEKRPHMNSSACSQILGGCP